MANVIIYTTQSCPHCHRAKELLKRKKIAFEEIDVADDFKKRQEIQDRYGWMTVPIIIMDGKFIGGANELTKLV